MWVITIDPETCQGDGECGDICPVQILSVAEVDRKKMATVSGNPDDCIGCMSCVTTCENSAITVQEF